MLGVDSMEEVHCIQEGELQLQSIKGEEKQYRRGYDSV